MIKHFTQDQKRIYDEWRSRKADQMTPQDYEQQMAYLERQMAAICGGG